MRALLLILSLAAISISHAADRPNILIMMSDDQSFPHASAYGSKMVNTPHFDRIARDGILFTNAFCASPGCSPSRAAFLTGRHTWQIEHAGTHASSFDQKYKTFMDLLADAGYETGYTGKGWGPGNFKVSGRNQNPAGPNFNAKNGDYSAAFKSFLDQRPKDKPFCFWFGSNDPHRSYDPGSGLKSGKTLAQAEVPTFLPDTPEIRSDLLDYALEIERFDRDCGKMLELLEATGELDNTLVIITSDNGMPFPYAKANCTEFGIHMPLAVSWKNKFPAARTATGLISFIDLTATIHAATGIQPPTAFPLSGKNYLPQLTSTTADPILADSVFAARERHSSSRYRSLGYPQRCIRTPEYLLIWNTEPDRWPAGAPQKFSAKPSSKLGPEDGGYHDIDGSPTLDLYIKNKQDPAIKPFFALAVNKRPKLELYDIRNDPGCINNLATIPDHIQLRDQLFEQLTNFLSASNDPRTTSNANIFETYQRYSSIRWFPTPDWAIEKPDSVPAQPWIDSIKATE